MGFQQISLNEICGFKIKGLILNRYSQLKIIIYEKCSEKKLWLQN
jgi:hypothetical protein